MTIYEHSKLSWVKNEKKKIDIKCTHPGLIVTYWTLENAHKCACRWHSPFLESHFQGSYSWIPSKTTVSHPYGCHNSGWEKSLWGRLETAQKITDETFPEKGNKSSDTFESFCLKYLTRKQNAQRFWEKKRKYCVTGLKSISSSFS